MYYNECVNDIIKLLSEDDTVNIFYELSYEYDEETIEYALDVLFEVDYVEFHPENEGEIIISDNAYNAYLNGNYFESYQ